MQGPNAVQLRVGSLKEIKVIIEQFEKFPLITKKRGDFQLFKRVFKLIQKKSI